MIYEVQRCETRDFVCNYTDYCYIDLDVDFLGYESGQHDKNPYLLFSQFINNSNLWWQCFLNDYNLLSDDTIDPIDDHLRQPNGELLRVTDVMGEDVGKAWNEFRCRNSRNFEDLVPLDIGNVLNFRKDDVSYDLHVTLVSLVHAVKQPASPPSYGCITLFRLRGTAHSLWK
jgi:hypothetical protein